jgi:hypothetical protein
MQAKEGKHNLNYCKCFNKNYTMFALAREMNYFYQIKSMNYGRKEIQNPFV